jgi:hypothetical protein
MKELRVSFKTAKLAKDIGFDWYVDHYYSTTKRDFAKIKPSMFDNSDNVLSRADYNNNYANTISAPTLEHLRQYIIEEYYYYPSVYRVNDKWVASVYNVEIGRYVVGYNLNHLFENYELALDKSLRLTIEFIRKYNIMKIDCSGICGGTRVVQRIKQLRQGNTKD